MSERKKRGRAQGSASEPPRETTDAVESSDTISESGSETGSEIAADAVDAPQGETAGESTGETGGAAEPESSELPAITTETAFATERPPVDSAVTDEFDASSFDEEPRDGTLRGMRIADLVNLDPEMTVNLTGNDPEATVNLVGDPRDFPLRDDAAEAAFAQGVGFDEAISADELARAVQEAQDARDADSAEQEDDLGDAPTPLDATDVARTHLKGLLEALIFVSDQPIKPNDLAKSASAPLKEVKQLLNDLKGEYATRGVQLDEVNGGWIFRTSAAYAPFVRDLTKQKPVKLTRAQIETLAIMAYRQPITRPEIDEIRGVDSGPVLKLLLERDLVKILGKKDEPGRPLLYGTTGHFLEFFGLKSLKDLPTLREFTELNEDSRRVVEKELGDLVDPAQVEASPAAGEGEAGSDPKDASVDRTAFEDPPTETDAPQVALSDDEGAPSASDTIRPAKLEEDGETHADRGSSDGRTAERFDEDAHTAIDHGGAPDAATREREDDVSEEVGDEDEDGDGSDEAESDEAESDEAEPEDSEPDKQD